LFIYSQGAGIKLKLEIEACIAEGIRVKANSSALGGQTARIRFRD